jgi:hypothetical protein
MGHVETLLDIERNHKLTKPQTEYLHQVQLGLFRLNASKGITRHVDYYRQKLEFCLTLLEGKQWPQ